MTSSVTTGFLDGTANHVASITSLGLTKGSNLYFGDNYDVPDVKKNHVVIFDLGQEDLEDFGHTHINWTLVFRTSRKEKLEAIEEIRDLADALRGKRFLAKSDSFEIYRVLTVRTVPPGAQLVGKLESGLYLAEVPLQFEVIAA